MLVYLISNTLAVQLSDNTSVTYNRLAGHSFSPWNVYIIITTVTIKCIFIYCQFTDHVTLLSELLLLSEYFYILYCQCIYAVDVK